MSEPAESFTLYLRGGTGAELRDALRPFGNGGDLERFSLDAWGAEVILGRGAEVALIRVPHGVESGALKTLIVELHQAARGAGLTLSDDITSTKSPEDLLHAFGLQGERDAAMQAGRPNARWGLGKTVAFWAAGGALLYGAYRLLEVVRALLHGMVEGR